MAFRSLHQRRLCWESDRQKVKSPNVSYQSIYSSMLFTVRLRWKAGTLSLAACSRSAACFVCGPFSEMRCLISKVNPSRALLGDKRNDPLTQRLWSFLCMAQSCVFLKDGISKDITARNTGDMGAGGLFWDAAALWDQLQIEGESREPKVAPAERAPPCCLSCAPAGGRKTR